MALLPCNYFAVSFATKLTQLGQFRGRFREGALGAEAPPSKILKVESS